MNQTLYTLFAAAAAASVPYQNPLGDRRRFSRFRRTKRKAAGGAFGKCNNLQPFPAGEGDIHPRRFRGMTLDQRRVAIAAEKVGLMLAIPRQ